MQYRLTREEQIEYIREIHLDQFKSLTGRETVEGYFDEFYDDYEYEYGPGCLFECLLSDLE